MAHLTSRCIDSDDDINDVDSILKESSGNVMKTPKPLSKTPGRMLVPKSTVKPSTRKIRRLRDVSSQMGANPLFQKWDGDLDESPRKSPSKARQPMRKMQQSTMHSSFEESDLEAVLAPSTVLRARSARPKSTKAKEDSDDSDVFGGNGTPQIKIGGVALDIAEDPAEESSNAEQTDVSKSALSESETETDAHDGAASIEEGPDSPTPAVKAQSSKEETDSQLMEESATSAADDTSEFTNGTYSDFDSFESNGSVGNRTAAKLLFQKRPNLTAPTHASMPSQSDDTVLSEVKNMTIVEEWDDESETADLIQNMLDLQLRDSMVTAPTPASAQEPARPATPTLPDVDEEAATEEIPSPSKQIRIPQTPHRQSTDAFWSQEVTNEWNDKHSPTKLILPAVKKSPSKSSPSKEARRSFDTTKQQIAQAFLAELDEKITDGQIAALAESTGGVKLNWTKSLNTTAGRANWKRETVRTRDADGTQIDARHKHHASIDLAEKVIDDEARLLNVMAHEFCHLANFMVSGITNNPHGKEFKSWAAKCSRAFGERGIKVTTKHTYEIDFKYIWECVSCGYEHKRHSKSIDPARHRCGKCKEELKQTRPVPRATGGKTAYQMFVKEQMKVVRDENPGATQRTVMKLIGEKWKAGNAKMEQEKKASASEEDVAEKMVDLTMADDA